MHLGLQEPRRATPEHLRLWCSYRAASEDRLTEIMATTLDVHDGFRRVLLERLGVGDWDIREVRTQETFEYQTRLVDIVVYCDQRGEPATVFIENKVDGYWFSEFQAQRQRAALAQRPGPQLLAGIAEDSDLAVSQAGFQPRLRFDPRSAYDFVLGWSDVQRLAERAGADFPQPWGGTRWHDQALDPRAPACQRLLHEFVSYLGGEALAALDENAVLALKLMDAAWERLESVLASAAGLIGTHSPIPNPKRGEDYLFDGPSPAGATCRYAAYEPPVDH
jgi:hypothetical protein